jgi:hypothetical protein
MAETGNPKQYNLEDRTYEFARDLLGLVKQLPRTLANIEHAGQLANLRKAGRMTMTLHQTSTPAAKPREFEALPFGNLNLFRISGFGFRICPL